VPRPRRPAGQGVVLNYVGEMLARYGDGRRAREHYAGALALAREISAPHEEARAVEGMGHCLLRDGDPGGAVAHWRQALMICQRICASDAERNQETLRQHCITIAAPPPGGGAVGQGLQRAMIFAARLAGSHQPGAHAPGRGRGAGGQAELVEDVGQVPLDGVLA
jgi:hypothetical protein